MKKILTILLALLVLVGCGNKADTWEKVESEYEDLKQEVINITSNTESFLKGDYLNSIDELKELVTNLEKSTDEDNKENLQKIYKLACYIQAVSSNYTGVAANKINDAATVVTTLIETTYDGTDEDFATAKQDALDKLDELENLSNKEWSEVEKKTLLKWEDVEADYDTLTKDAKADMTDAKEVTEIELEGYKDDIIEKYEEIEYGVTVFNQDYAKDIYKDAVILYTYARKTASDQGQEVEHFAHDTMSYVKQCYGKTLTEDEALKQDYATDIEQASKWTQSVWNYITTELKV